VEAWAAGTPLIASNVGGPGELLKGQVEGLLFESGNAEELRGKIQSLLTDANQRQSLKQAGLKKVTQYSWRKRGEKLLSIYAEVGLRLNNCEAA
jgi:glycosyltransferase involved in cell wall biosynthesis